MTPCEKRGWKVGDWFRCVETEDATFAPGSIVVLIRDDGTTVPYFKLVLGEVIGPSFTNGAGDTYADIEEVEKIPKRVER